jgi:hypothetical protein
MSFALLCVCVCVRMRLLLVVVALSSKMHETLPKEVAAPTLSSTDQLILHDSTHYSHNN